jgi:4-amino-4-deoxy-L-arabinose transferase-like glycosyltransferase
MLLAIVLAAIGIRFTYTATTGHSFAMIGLEGQLAHNILADGRWFARNAGAEAYILPLGEKRKRLLDPASIDYKGINKPGEWFPEISESVGAGVIITGVWAITGDERFVQVQILQSIVGGLAALLVYWIAMQLFKRRRPAMIAAALYAIYPPIAWQTVDPYNDTWAVNFTLAIVALYLLALRSDHRWRWLIACGVCAGIGAYFRPSLLLLAPALALATVFSTGWREAFRRIVVTTAVASLLLVPWTIRNYDEFHAFIPTRAGFWVTMWRGFNETANDGAFTDNALVAKIHQVRPDLVPETPEWDSYVKPYVIETIEHHPFWYVKLLTHRLAISTVWQWEPYWMHLEAGRYSDYKGSLVAFAVSHPLDTLEDLLEPAVFLLAMLGLGLTWRRNRQQQAILVALVLAVLVPYLAIHVEARYLLPAVPAYFIWIGLGADRVIERVVARSRRTTSRMARAQPAIAPIGAGGAPPDQSS